MTIVTTSKTTEYSFIFFCDFFWYLKYNAQKICSKKHCFLKLLEQISLSVVLCHQLVIQLGNFIFSNIFFLLISQDHCFPFWNSISWVFTFVQRISLYKSKRSWMFLHACLSGSSSCTLHLTFLLSEVLIIVCSLKEVTGKYITPHKPGIIFLLYGNVIVWVGIL